ncbi:class I SAM-dependent RNA methyltransferase [Parafrigoribacterium soli]|uniref:class I SAM-dependent RNA methyltransferase n=1 Tax=Parafrigoribacterium soli TaxID=3144663 RepID=UPI0032EF1217
MAENQGTEIELEVTKVAHGGIAVARYEGRVVFVSDAIPGETVRARVSDDSRPSFWRAETTEVLEPSEFRQPHIWAAASVERAPKNRAGGAEFGHIVPDHQRELKRQVLTEALQRMAGIDSDVTVEALPGAEDGTGWRTRVRLHVAEDGTPGPYSARSHRVVPVQELPLATPELAAIAPLTETFPGESVIDVIAPSSGNPWVLTGETPQSARQQRGRGKGARQKKAAAPKPQTIVETVGDREFRLDVRGFWQVHRAAPQTLTRAVQEAVDESLFDPHAANLDLYGGVGLLAAALGDRFGQALRITTVESDSRATEHAAENLAEWVGAVSVTARVERYLQQLRASAGPAESGRLKQATVILDPPRSGAGKAVVDELVQLAPAQLIYVACDPVALARDVALFSARGYELVRLRAFDLFPNTHHVEAVATLRR